MTPILKLLLELGPLAVFFIAFSQFKTDESVDPTQIDALIAATVAFMIALAVSTGVTYALTRKISKMAAITFVIVVVMGALTVWLRDGVFIMMKPTMVNGFFAALLGFGLLQGQSYMKLVMGELLPMHDEGWMKLTRNWALFFAGMAVLNEIVWRTQSTDFWVNFKVFGVTPLTMVFAIAQMPLTKRYAVEPASLEASEADAGDVRK